MAWYIWLIIIIFIVAFFIDMVTLFADILPNIPYFPKGIKEEFELTWFGAIFVFVFFLILFWFHYVIILILFLFKGYKWLKEYLY